MKRTTKRKMYQKRRKKQKLDQRKNTTQTMLQETTAINNRFKYNNNNARSKSEPKPSKNKPYRQNVSFGPITSYSQGLQLWWQTYCTALEFHTKQQNTWHVDRQENELMLLEKYANEYETSSEEEDESDTYAESSSNEADINHETENNRFVNEFVDEDYIKFLEITHKHQEEMRLKRSADNC